MRAVTNKLYLGTAFTRVWRFFMCSENANYDDDYLDDYDSLKEARLAFEAEEKAYQEYLNSPQYIEYLIKQHEEHCAKVDEVLTFLKDQYELELSFGLTTKNEILNELKTQFSLHPKKENSGHYTLPHTERKELVAEYRRLKKRGKITNKAAWAASKGITVRTLLNWEKEFPE